MSPNCMASCILAWWCRVVNERTIFDQGRNIRVINGHGLHWVELINALLTEHITSRLVPVNVTPLQNVSYWTVVDQVNCTVRTIGTSMNVRYASRVIIFRLFRIIPTVLMACVA